MKHKWKLLLLIAPIAIIVSCKSQNSSDINQQKEREFTIDIHPEIEEGTVDPRLMGFNIVYSYAPDSLWKGENAKIPRLLRNLNTGVLRYPGGTVVTYFHWKSPTGQGWSDSWDPSYDPNTDQPASAYMDLDEYLEVCKKLKTEPLIGINMGSGKKYDRVEEGIEESRQLILHLKNKGIKVKYLYLDNEPYHHTANYTFTAEEYADMVNIYVPAIKEIDSETKFIVNTHPRDTIYTKVLLGKAGKNIDYIDIHNYWKWGNATYENWKNETVMHNGAGLRYQDQRQFYRNFANSLGYPNIDFITLEWNIGQTGKGNKEPSEAEVALMVAEQFTQFIKSGMPMATFWPVSLPQITESSNRTLLDSQEDYAPNKVYEVFELYKSILGQEKTKTTSSSEAIHALSVKSKNNDTLWVYLINKNPHQNHSDLKLILNNYKGVVEETLYFDSEQLNTNSLGIRKIKTHKDRDGNYGLKLKQFSMAKLTIIKKP